MYKLLIDWLGSCDKCGSEEPHCVETTFGDHGCLYDGDDVTCESCGHTGEIEADGENAWCVWGEYD